MSTACLNLQHASSEILSEIADASEHIDVQAWKQCFPSNIENAWWYQVLERSHLQSQFRFGYIVLRKAGQPAGIAPFFIMDLPLDLALPEVVLRFTRPLSKVFRSLAYQKTVFIGSPCAEEGRVGLVSGIDPRGAMKVVQETAEALAIRSGAAMIVWKDFRQPFLAADSAVLEAHNLFKVISYPGTEIHVRNMKSLDDYLASLDSARRKRLKKKLLKSHAQGELLVEVVQYPDDEILTDIYTLFSQTYARGKTKFEKLGIEFFRQCSKQQTAWFILLRCPNTRKLVAFNLCFLLETTVVQKFIGLDYSLGPEWFLYFRLWEASMNWALSNDIDLIQCGQTGYSAKLELGYKLRPLYNYAKHLNPIVHKVYARVAKTVTWSSLDSDLDNAHTKLVPNLITGA